MQLLLRYEVGRCRDCGEPIFFGDDVGEAADGGLVCADCRDAGWVKCSDCGKWMPDGDDVRDADGNTVCAKCLELDYRRCEKCGEWVRKSDGENDIDGNFVCRDCLDSFYLKCHGCGEWVRERDAYNIGGKWFCESCADHWTTCSECGDLIDTRDCDYQTTHDGETICEDCYENDFFTCESCGEIFHRDYEVYRESRDASYCESCDPGEEGEEDEDGIFGYHGFADGHSYSPRYVHGERPEWKTPDSRRPRLYGVELECDGGSFDSSDFSGWTDDGYLVHFEHDGSLSSFGVECISQPCSLKFHQQKMEWERILAKFVAQGFTSHNTESCGLHVHVGRRELSPVTVSKLDIFLNRGKDFFSQIARRHQFYSSDYDVGKRLSAGKGRRYGTCDDRYQAVNTTNSDTVEIRIFRGTLKLETLLGTLEMVDALIRFLNGLPLGRIYETEENILKFVDFCGQSHKDYPHLLPMMKRLVKSGSAVPNIANWCERIERHNQRKEMRKCA